MSTKDEEDAWRSIVENYGERARLDDPVEPVDPVREQRTDDGTVDDAPEAEGTTAVPERPVRPDFVPFEGTVADEPDPFEERLPRVTDEETFVPPTPPLPYVAPRRLAAWCVLVLAPLTLLVCGALDVYLPAPLRGVLVAAPLAAFGYLVATMSRDPRDPFDDGARV